MAQAYRTRERASELLVDRQDLSSSSIIELLVCRISCTQKNLYLLNKYNYSTLCNNLTEKCITKIWRFNAYYGDGGGHGGVWRDDSGGIGHDHGVHYGGVERDDPGGIDHDQGDGSEGDCGNDCICMDRGEVLGDDAGDLKLSNYFTFSIKESQLKLEHFFYLKTIWRFHFNTEIEFLR